MCTTPAVRWVHSSPCDSEDEAMMASNVKLTFYEFREAVVISLLSNVMFGCFSSLAFP